MHLQVLDEISHQNLFIYLMIQSLLIHSDNVTQINYLVKARNDKMKLIEGDSETFSDVLNLIDDYEGKLRMSYGPHGSCQP